MAIVSPALKKLTADTRRWIRVNRETGDLAIPQGLRVSVISSPSLNCSSVDVEIIDAPATWATVEAKDPFGNPTRKITADASAVGVAIASYVREQGAGTYACFVYADCALIGTYARHSQD